MYAIIQTGGKQYRVESGEVIYVELLDIPTGGGVEFRDIVFLNNGKESRIGSPYLENSCVKGELLGEVRGPKVISFKYKQRKGIRRKVGHRQNYHKVKITEIIG